MAWTKGRGQCRMQTITASSILIRDPFRGLYLGVSRKDNPTAFGFPGGKVDPVDEGSPEAAAIRELREETGLILSNPRLVFHGTSAGDKDFYVGTYVGDVTGEIKTTEAGVVEWVTAHQLIHGPFGAYNLALLESLGLWPDKPVAVFQFKNYHRDLPDLTGLREPLHTPWFDAAKKGYRPTARIKKRK